MKYRLTSAVAVAAVLAGATAPSAGAATEKILTGKMTSVTYNAAKQTGKLHIISASGKKTTIGLNAQSDCGVSYGQSGDQIPCKTITSSKYRGRMLRVVANRYSDGHHTAKVVGIDLTK